jgi:di/tricarboxylate transporter
MKKSNRVSQISLVLLMVLVIVLAFSFSLLNLQAINILLLLMIPVMVICVVNALKEKKSLLEVVFWVSICVLGTVMILAKILRDNPLY